MAKNCIYCKVSLDANSAIDVCQRCGIGVWGQKMFEAIVQNMNNAKDSGDLYQGSVTDSPQTQKKEAVQSTPQNNTSSFSSQQSSPRPSSPLQSQSLAPNNALKSMAEEAMAFQESHPKEDLAIETPAVPTINNQPAQDLI